MYLMKWRDYGDGLCMWSGVYLFCVMCVLFVFGMGGGLCYWVCGEF